MLKAFSGKLISRLACLLAQGLERCANYLASPYTFCTFWPLSKSPTPLGTFDFVEPLRRKLRVLQPQGQRHHLPNGQLIGPAMMGQIALIEIAQHISVDVVGYMHKITVDH